MARSTSSSRTASDDGDEASTKRKRSRKAASRNGPARSDREALIEVEEYRKVFKTGLLRRKPVEAVKEVSFAVHREEIVGFLGPNGSGKTTTIKMLLGLISATSGTARMFGQTVPSKKARKRIGFLPENPYVYPHLTPREFVQMCGQLSGMRGKSLRKRTEEVLDKTGVLYAADRQVRRLSKGMLQRSALAAALVSDPEMLILDEPMSGLDPVGRKEVRDLIHDERDLGRTVFFSTHILSDVEALCDHVIILSKGEVVVSGSIRELLRGKVTKTAVMLENVSDELGEKLAEADFEMQRRPDVVVVDAEGQERVDELLSLALDHGANVLEVTPHRDTLEDLFMRRAL
jgi:ABC-2 type transport system ATP-binding protein